ncbi:MlaA family lipoprotein [Shimia marina]|uniref:Putative phospholipid-binding lipoprotein MlaA n=1 Tax=Shimia marina TaxID=321267 RepID=A0A0N7LRJ8_9RHOB|nr:VacJ family lipoprotein [Shimia marina]CUH51020.1 putative phospholipid-binding lipoprotein MlaA precursor [Shimia marina]SFD60142.1 phospholipid-binding lipoprotein MlaA [Shimia marina]
MGQRIYQSKCAKVAEYKEKHHVPPPLNLLHRLKAVLLLSLAVAALAACTGKAPNPASGINDPNEAANRRIHAFNKSVDKALLSPASTGYGTVIPKNVRGGVSNFADHLSLPNDIINNTLQGNFHEASSTVARFMINTFFGVAGIFDVAGNTGMERFDTDFGETLHVWGAGEGAYTEIPFFGPSTTRDAYGLAVDIVLDPFFVVTREPTKYIGGVAYVINAMGNRYDFDETIDSILYDSADSYAQARLIYLQNRRFDLGMTDGNAYVDPEFDPYEDPYADF